VSGAGCWQRLFGMLIGLAVVAFTLGRFGATVRRSAVRRP